MGPALLPHQSRVVERISQPDQPGLVVVHGLGSGKCVRGDTPVLTDKGLLRIRDLFPQDLDVTTEVTLDGGGYRVLSLVDSSARWSSVRARYAQRLDPSEYTLQIVTHRGSEVHATKSHPLLVLREGRPTWVQARDVAVGDWAVMPDRLTPHPSPRNTDASLAACAAWLTTEGWEDSKKRGSFTITQYRDHPLLESIRCWMRDVYGVGRVHGSGRSFIACSRAFADDLQLLGHRWGLKSSRKSLPCALLAGDLDSMRETLRICWEAEGHVSENNAEITSASRFLMEQYRYLLLFLGGRSSCRSKVSRATNGAGPYREYWRSSVSGEDLEALASAVKGTRKGRKLTKLASRKRNPNTGIPVDWLYQSLGLSPKFFGCSVNNQRSVSRASALRILEKLQWLDSDIAIRTLSDAIPQLSGTAKSYAQRNLRVAKRRDDVRVAHDRLRAIVYGPYRFEQIESTTPGESGGVVYDVEVDSDVYDRKNYVGGYGAWYLHNTLTSIAAQKALGGSSQVVAPAALLGNYRKELGKHYGKNAPDPAMVSMQQAARTGVPAADNMVVDEAHRARDTGSSTYQALRDATNSKRLLLTGSPFYNHPSDIATLLRIAAGKAVVPEDKVKFTERYIYDKPVKPGLIDRFIHGATEGTVPTVRPERVQELKDVFSKWVDHHPGSREGFPDVEHADVQVPMSKEQLRVYQTLMDKAPPWVSAKVRRGLPPSKQEAKDLNAFLSGVRQVSNSTSGFHNEGEASHPKIQKAFENLRSELESNPQSKAVVYSNFLQSGINPYKQLLEGAKIPYGEFTGEMGRKERDQLVQDYNAGKLRALLLSSAGGEGLDLKGTRLLQVMEPHWNREKLRQVEGRGARYMSHSELPESDRKLRVENYLATLPEGTLGKLWRSVSGREKDQSVDEYLTRMSKNKEDLTGQFRKLLPAHEQPDLAPKHAANRSVKEWRKMQAAGDTSGADALAKSYGNLGNSPRYLKDVSLGGSEAAVDQMMGRVSNPNTGAINESGYVARKLYKPDSDISRGEYTNQLMHQKQQFSDQARSISPEAKAMVPDMYGHRSTGTGGLQRTVSDHEFVHGVSDIRGTKVHGPNGPMWSRSPTDRAKDLRSIESTVLNPMAAKGTHMVDTITEKGTNFGNVVQSSSGPKVMDFLPVAEHGKDPIHDSFRKYAPTGSSKYMSAPGMSEKSERSLQKSLRKEVYKPTQAIQEASPKMQMAAAAHLRGEGPSPSDLMAKSRGPNLNTATSAPTAATNVGALRTRGGPAATAVTAAPKKLAPASIATVAPMRDKVQGVLSSASHTVTPPSIANRLSSVVSKPTALLPRAQGQFRKVLSHVHA